MKTIGIVCDNYKLEKFKKELKSQGFDNFKVYPFTQLSSNIQVKTEENRIKEIEKICTTVELYFRRSN